QGWVSANFADSGHKHSAADITSGTLSSARIPDLAISKIINLQSSLNGKSGMGANTYTGVQTAPGFTVSSSRELKTDIRALDMPGDTIDFFQPVTFRYKANPDREVAGMIREEVMEIFPLACTDEGIDYGQLVPLLILTIQQDRAKLRELIGRVAALEGEAA
ncbi:MAG TPA: tail fiber domain-containing protein, partial [Luteimonas sp.]